MANRKIRIGVLGAFRGNSMIRFCRESGEAELAAVCDRNEQVLAPLREELQTEAVCCCSSFEEFLRQDMDAVVLANDATGHAPLAIRCLEAGRHVYSEVVPVQTMREAVELVEAAERTGLVYAYGENYCYMPAPREMRRLYREGAVGEFEYGEGEYIHNCEPIWPAITYGDPEHWRNNMYATFYCTHSIGPLLHITGLRPVRVTGFEGTKTERKIRCGAKGGSFGMEMVELENGGILKSIHGDLYRDSVWYSLYGSKGRMESGLGNRRAGYPFCMSRPTRIPASTRADRSKLTRPPTASAGRPRRSGTTAPTFTLCTILSPRFGAGRMRTPSASSRRWTCSCRGCSPTARFWRAGSRRTFPIFAARLCGTATGTIPRVPILLSRETA